MVCGQVGTLLWEMRTAGGWTMGRLAEQAGVSKMALSRWEAGTRQPRVPELEAVLNALNASTAQRTSILSRIHAPRAIQQLRVATENEEMSALPTTGDLLRALRVRKGWTQAQTAAAVEVTQATVARWERGERLPDSEQMRSLGSVLGAHREEIRALTGGRLSEGSPKEFANWKQAYEETERMLSDHSRFNHALGDLYYLSLEHKVIRWTLQHKQMRPLLARVYVWHGQFLRNVGRLAEVGEWVQRARQLVSLKAPEDFLRTVVLSGTAAVYSGNRITPERGLRVLNGWAERASIPAFAAWILSDSAKYASLSGRKALALTLAEQATVVARRSDNPMELFLRRCDLARILMENGRPCDALNILPRPEEGDRDWEQAEALLVWCEAYRQAGQKREGENLLQKAMHLIQTQNLTTLRARAAALTEC